MAAQSWQTVYFLGAGATRADFRNVTLGDGLLHRILTEEPDASPIREFLSEVFSRESLAQTAPEGLRPRLDDVFTLIDAHVAGRAPSPSARSAEHLREVRQRLIASIAMVLQENLGEADGTIARRFATALVREPSVVLSTNYDIVMDNALFKSDSVNYGVPVRYQLSGPGPGIRPGRFIHSYDTTAFKLTPEQTVHHDMIPQLKLHGSLNWLYCPRCDELDVTLEKSGAIRILKDPTAGRCRAADCTARYEAVLVGPSLEQRYENRILRDTWSLAEQALATASRLVVVGYSLPEADYLIRALLARHFSRRSDRVTVVDTVLDSFAEDLFEQRYRRLFPEFHYETYGFEGLAERMEKLAES